MAINFKQQANRDWTENAFKRALKDQRLTERYIWEQQASVPSVKRRNSSVRVHNTATCPPNSLLVLPHTVLHGLISHTPLSLLAGIPDFIHQAHPFSHCPTELDLLVDFTGTPFVSFLKCLLQNGKMTRTKWVVSICPSWEKSNAMGE